MPFDVYILESGPHLLDIKDLQSDFMTGTFQFVYMLHDTFCMIRLKTLESMDKFEPTCMAADKEKYLSRYPQ